MPTAESSDKSAELATAGVRLRGEQSVRIEPTGPTVTEIMTWLRNHPPVALADMPVLHVQDQLVGEGGRPASDAVVIETDQCQIVVRPSPTDAKLEIHGECRRPPAPSAEQDNANRVEAHQQLSAAIAAVVALVSDPERSETSERLHALRLDSDTTIEDRAAALFSTAPKTLPQAQALRLAVNSIDLTTLMGDDTDGRVRALCAQALRPDPVDATVGPVAAVCVYPDLVALAVDLTAGSDVAVASVAGAFPSGLSSLEVRLSDIAEAVCAGAAEIDIVINRAAFLAGDHVRVRDELQSMRQQIGGRVMKVILETSELGSPEAIRAASELAMDAGADWIKTSTGKSGVGATPVAVMAMAEAIANHAEHHDSHVGLKISGGVRTSADALGYLAIIEDVLGPGWLDPSRVRFGASGLLTTLVNDLAASAS